LRKINILVVDDQHLVMAGICGLLALKPHLQVVAQLSDGSNVLDAIKMHSVDVLLLDIRMPKVDGLQVLQALNKEKIKLPTLMLTTFDEHELVLSCIKLGALGYLRKDVNLDELIYAIETVAKQEQYFQPAITQQLQNNLKTSGLSVDETKSSLNNKSTHLIEALTSNELQILRLITAGYSNNEIADALHKSSGRIRNIVTNILAKLQVRDRTRAVIKALELGLL